MSDDLALNARVKRKGFITQVQFLRCQPSSELEKRLGYGQDTLNDGWWLLFLEELPSPNDFEYMGYTYMSGGIPQGHLDPQGGLTAEERLRLARYDVHGLKRKTIRDVFTLIGHKRLAKLVPIRKATDFPPGTGLPQWRLINALSFRVAAHIQPGKLYTGSYT